MTNVFVTWNTSDNRVQDDIFLIEWICVLVIVYLTILPTHNGDDDDYYCIMRHGHDDETLNDRERWNRGNKNELERKKKMAKKFIK